MKPVATAVVPARRKELQGELTGVSVTTDAGVGYTLGVLGGEKVRMGGERGAAGSRWDGPAPAAQENELGTSLTVDFDLGPREARTIRFVLAWYAPLWKGEGTHCFTHLYATRYPDSPTVAQKLAREHGALLQRILNWQQAVYTDEELPVWLREALVNNLYLINEVGMWAAAKPPIGDWCRPQDGLFGMNESPREYPKSNAFRAIFTETSRWFTSFPSWPFRRCVATKSISFPTVPFPGSLAAARENRQPRGRSWPCPCEVTRPPPTESPTPTWWTSTGCVQGASKP